ncbi:MAG: alanine racemase [Clostridiales bacterium]|nr:alanine racemase [Clostridiales bacterium]
MYHVTKAIIDKTAIKQNYLTIQNHIQKNNSNAAIICVLKADGYGHGALTCAEIYHALGARHFAVSNLDEALALREAVPDSMLLILGYTDPKHAEILRQHQITQTVFSLSYAKALSANLKGELSIHLKVDTGMNRLGFRADENGCSEAICAAGLPHLHADGLYTHFARADEADPAATNQQFERFCAFDNRLKQAGIHIPIRHVCNSAAAIQYPNMHLDAVRCGIILYGLRPSQDVPDIGLMPVMSLKTKIVHIHTITVGEAVSYGGDYSPAEPKTIATLPIGYDDGLIRTYAKDCGVYVHGKFAKILGRICMDQCMIDITGIDCQIGDEVCIFGAEQSADVFAAAANTINYEVTCIVGKRVPRETR